MGRDLGQYDVVFYDSLPNDEKLSPHVGSDDFVNRILFEQLSTIASQTRLVILGFSWKHSEPVTSVFSTRQALADCLSAQFVSFRDLTFKFGSAILGADAPLFEVEEAHPARAFAHQVGEQIALNLEELIKSTPKTNHRATNFSSNFHHDELVATNPGATSVNIHNSRLTADLIECGSGHIIYLDETRRCIGIYVNRPGTCCCIKYLGNGVIAQRLFLGGRPELLEIVFVPLKDGMRSNGLQVHNRRYDGPLADLQRMPIQLQAWKALYWDGDPEEPIESSQSEEPGSSEILQRTIEKSLSLIIEGNKKPQT